MPPPPPPASPVPPPPPPSTPPPPPPAAPKKSNKTLVIVLVILGILFLLIAGCAVSCFVIGKKAQSALSKYEKHPEMAGIAVAASMHPDLQVVSEDANAGIIVIKNKKTGEVLQLDMAQIKSGSYERAFEQLAAGQKVSASQEADEAQETPAPKTEEPKVSAAKASSMEAAIAKFPKFLPAYPQAQTLTARVVSTNGALAGQYEATTKQAPVVVAEFYSQAVRAAGLEIAEQSEDSNDFGPVITISSYFNGGAVTVRIESQDGGKTGITADFAGAAK